MNLPPPYNATNEEKELLSFSQWTVQQVGEAVAKMGSATVWERYAGICIKEELDGATISAATAEDLVKEYGFKIVHARAVVRYFQPDSSDGSRGYGLTEEDTKLIQPIVQLLDQCKQSATRLEGGLTSLEKRREECCDLVQRWFAHALQVLEGARLAALQDIEAKCRVTQILLNKHLATTREVEQEALVCEQQCLSLPAKSISEIQERTRQISELMKQCLARPVPGVAEEVCTLSVTFSEALAPFFEDGDAQQNIIQVNINEPDVSAKLIPMANDFVFRSDWDENGIMYWLGTKGKTRAFIEPTSDPMLAVATSSWTVQASTPAAFHRPSSGAVSNYIPAANFPGWFQLEFKTVSVIPSYYTLRTDTNGDYAVRHWKFQGSNDGRAWVDLSTHNNDAQMSTSPSASASWPVPKNTPFCFFRLLCTGGNSRDDKNLMMNGFEVYGKLRSK